MYVGALVGPYRVLRQLGAGGMGVVWLAEDQRLNRKVALKMVKGSDAETTEGRQRLMREARAAAALNHPHIATVHDVLDVDGKVIVVFEYVEGETLSARLQRGAMEVAEAVEVAWQLADALAAAHAQGVIHRDLKPSNVVIGPESRAKVLDFGIARMVPIGADPSGTAPGTIGGGLVGTPGYAAPEQYLSRNVDGRADLYALGVMLFEMIAGRRPFPGSDAVALATSVLRDEAPKLSSTGLWVPAPLDKLVSRLLEKDADKRPASGDEVLVELSPLRDMESSPLARRTVLIRRKMPLSTKIAAVALVAVVIGLVGYTQMYPRRLGPEAPVVAVLPLTNSSGDASNDYLGAGLAESLITSLAAVPKVTVLSRTAVEETRQQNPDRASFVRSLDASYIVTGSVQAVADQLRVTLNLERPDASVAWGETVQGPASDLFALQTRLATLLADAIVDQTPAAERTGARRADYQQRDRPARLLERTRTARSPRDYRQSRRRAGRVRARHRRRSEVRDRARRIGRSAVGDVPANQRQGLGRARHCLHARGHRPGTGSAQRALHRRADGVSPGRLCRRKDTSAARARTAADV